jgi:tRNA A-37 threonylcarbamoyl transferase component Bud32
MDQPRQPPNQSVPDEGADTPGPPTDRTPNLDDSTGAPPAAKVDPYLGKTIDGRYLVESLLGEGGMGVVYSGKHKVIGKKVAIKVLRGEMARDTEITERFLQEARAASSIGNPHIIDISDFGTLPDGSTYFVMEYLAGKSLTDVMNETKPLGVPRLLHIAKQLTAGLGAAHEAGIVHRDLKPDNVMLIRRGAGEAGKDFVKILDFGIAKVGGESRLTRAGSVFGTPHYMSPEQAAGTPVDLRTDLYALGIILYEMASGKVPFDADNFMGILTQHMYKAPVPILALVPAPEIPPALDAIIQKCLTKKVEGRYPTMAALLLDLEKLERGETPDALGEMMARSGGFNIPADYFRISGMPAPVPARPHGVPKRGRWPLLAAMGAVATLGIAALAVTITRPSASKAQGGDSPPAASSAGSAASAAVPVTTTSSAAVVAPPPPPAVQHVDVVVDPQEAKVVRDGTTANLNTPSETKQPGVVSIEVPRGTTVNLDITAPGRKPSKIMIDGSRSTLSVRLEAAPQAPGKPKPPKNDSSAKKCDPAVEICNDPFK